MPYSIGTRIAPVVATTVTIVTLITCVSIAKARDIYLGGLAWPYFSDTGRVALILTWLANYEFKRELIDKNSQETSETCRSSIRKYCEIVRVVGVLSTFGLPILEFFSTTSFPDTHKYGAYWFFLLETVSLVVNVSMFPMPILWIFISG
ncbi:Hypothetical protein PHPALM_37309 [Phytophthora palmivora]|uniref:Uncharacterized protein n=1 Tax=Phytophthora palmivora TaxID=4796 RepID=A0A2P4WXR3_9STRA|nr:Hypothetical protein PHPALM_37309 [Phytophthora palmivora]